MAEPTAFGAAVQLFHLEWGYIKYCWPIAAALTPTSANDDRVRVFDNAMEEF